MLLVSVGFLLLKNQRGGGGAMVKRLISCLNYSHMGRTLDTKTSFKHKLVGAKLRKGSLGR